MGLKDAKGKERGHSQDASECGGALARCERELGINRKHMNFFFLISLYYLLQISCHRSPVLKNNFNSDSYFSKGLDSIKIERKKLVLAREVCLPGYFNVICYNKPSPYFVHLDLDDFMNSYDSFIYNAYASRVLAKQLDTLDINIVGNWFLDTLFNHSITDSNIIEFNIPRKNHNKIKKNVSKNYPTLKYDRKIRFALYELEFECLYVGEEPVYMPGKNVKTYENDHFIAARKFYITNILGIIPMNKIIYIENYKQNSTNKNSL